jgi:hypothetical protein
VLNLPALVLQAGTVTKGGKSQSRALSSTATSLREMACDMRPGPLRAKLLVLAIECDQQAEDIDVQFHRPASVPQLGMPRKNGHARWTR